MTRISPIPWFGRERRRNVAINQLARQLYNVCRNAADPFELAAQLESLGYSRYRVSREFGLHTTFELAERLFALTPRRPQLATSRHSVASPFWWQLAITVALALSLLLYRGFEGTPNDLMFAWLLTWTLSGTYFMRGLGSADLATKKRVFTLLLSLGLLGVGVSVYFVKPDALEATLGLVWWQLPATFWLSVFAPPQRLGHFVASLLAVFAFFMPPLASAALVFLAALLLFVPFLALPKVSTFRFLVKNWPPLVLPALLGLGQSFLLLQVFPSSAHPTAGLAIIVTTLLVTSWLETSFKRSVAKALWEARSSEEFQDNIFRSLGFSLRLLTILAFLAALVLLNLLLPSYSAALLPCMILALALAFSLLLLGFNDVFLPATAFIIASLLLFAGLPFLPVVIALTALLGIAVVLYITKVERYGVELL